jgi:hypothetical protein
MRVGLPVGRKVDGGKKEKDERRPVFIGGR